MSLLKDIWACFRKMETPHAGEDWPVQIHPQTLSDLGVVFDADMRSVVVCGRKVIIDASVDRGCVRWHNPERS